MPKIPPDRNRFKKGQTGNPKGSSQKARELAAVKRLSTEQVADIGSLILTGGFEGLYKIAQDPKETALRAWTAALIIKGHETGNPAIYNAILDRIIGKPAEKKTVVGADGGPLSLRISEETDEEKQARAEKLRAMRVILEEDAGG